MKTLTALILALALSSTSAFAAGIDPEDGFLMCGPYGYEVPDVMTMCEVIESSFQDQQECWDSMDAKDAEIASLKDLVITIVSQKSTALKQVKALKATVRKLKRNRR